MSYIILKNHKENRLNYLAYLLIPHIDPCRPDYVNIDFSYRNDFRSTSVKAYSKEFVIILDTNFTISDLTIKTDVTRPMNYCTTLWEYDGQCYSTTVDGNAVDIWILSFQDDSWSDADIYVIPHYRSDRENLSDSEYNDWKFFRK